ncbi:MAG: radical SAM protein [Dehalococcoidales bacterium]|nr:MAG: radical SAM protein [Dehalococcoidales bacterium]
MSAAASIGPIRPPSEAYSLLVRVTENCPWNRCEFCSTYKGESFRVRSMEDVKEDIRANRSIMDEVVEWAGRTDYSIGDIARLNGILWLEDDGVKSAFLQDSDSLVVKTEQLAEIIKFLRETFPTLERVCSYVRGKTLFRKKPEELRRLREAGLSRLHVGLETGDDELLAYVRKGATAEEMVQGGKKAVEAGFEVSEYIMPGLGGRERWQQHAKNSARVLNEINPRFIRLRTFRPVPGTLMYDRARRGEYHVQSIEGVLEEIRTFIEDLEVTSELITSDFATNSFMGDIDGILPEDKDRLLESVDKVLAYWREKGEPERNPFFRRIAPELT